MDGDVGRTRGGAVEAEAVERPESIVLVVADWETLPAATLSPVVCLEVSQCPGCGLRLQVRFGARIVVDVGFGDFGQPPIRAAFLVERLLQQPRFVGTVEPARVSAR